MFFFQGVGAKTLFRPFLELCLTVSIRVQAWVPVATGLTAKVVRRRHPSRCARQVFLPRHPHVHRPTPLASSPLVTCPSALHVVSAHVHPCFLCKAKYFCVPILTSVGVVSKSIRSAPTITRLRVLFNGIPIHLYNKAISGGRVGRPRPPVRRLVPAAPTVTMTATVAAFGVILRASLPFVLRFFLGLGAYPPSAWTNFYSSFIFANGLSAFMCFDTTEVPLDTVPKQGLVHTFLVVSASCTSSISTPLPLEPV